MANIRLMAKHISRNNTVENMENNCSSYINF